MLSFAWWHVYWFMICHMIVRIYVFNIRCICLVESSFICLISWWLLNSWHGSINLLLWCNNISLSIFSWFYGTIHSLVLLKALSHGITNGRTYFSLIDHIVPSAYIRLKSFSGKINFMNFVVWGLHLPANLTLSCMWFENGFSLRCRLLTKNAFIFILCGLPVDWDAIIVKKFCIILNASLLLRDTWSKVCSRTRILRPAR